MKTFKDVEANRRNYHADPALNSVHRASLTVPEIPGATVEISFVNHFLLKRNYRHVACRVTAVNPHGERIESRLYPVDEPRVYDLTLTGGFDGAVDTYLVEFFAAENLFIPFPAVMVNHRGDAFLNTVHAYNRVLNDVFEDDAINARVVAEASIDVQIDRQTDTFFMFTSGPRACREDLGVELIAGSNTLQATVALDQPRLTTRAISLKELFPGAPEVASGFLKVHQPAQPMFYGRLFTGRRTGGNAFSANHSYYDSSTAAEYWDDDTPSRRTYPYFPELSNTIRMHPIMSAGRLALSLEFYAADGALLGRRDAGELTSPGPRMAEISVDEAAAAAGIDGGEIASFSLIARPAAGATPSRVNHQLVHGAGALASSINMSLDNLHIFRKRGAPGFKWGQVPVGGDIDSWLGFATDRPDGRGCELEVTFYDRAGEVATRHWTLPANGAVIVRPAELLARELERSLARSGGNLWYVARSDRTDVTGYTVSRHSASNHCTGEHNF
jgi:hypothetical protein